LLFLCSGSVIHAVHSNEMTDMGGLRKKMPITGVYFLIGGLALAGVFPLAGFGAVHLAFHPYSCAEIGRGYSGEGEYKRCMKQG